MIGNVMDQGTDKQMDMDMSYDNPDSRSEQLTVQCRDADSSCWKRCSEPNNNR